VISEGINPTLLGVAAGTCGAWALSGVLSKLIYGVKATDPWTFIAVGTLLATVALAACTVPGYRATRIQPRDALHND
jgi:putative ABC transport system permease protein